MNEVILSQTDVEWAVVAVRKLAEMANLDTAKDLNLIARKLEKASKSDFGVKLVPCITDADGEEVVF